MEQIQTSTADQAPATTSVLKPCPHCGGQAKVTASEEPLRFGIVCTRCLSCFCPVYEIQELAIRRWNSRKGTASAYGGRATKGISTRKKRRACRRNLKRARERKKLVWIRTRVDGIADWLKAMRAAEIAEGKAAVARDRAELKLLEPRIMKYPHLWKYYQELILKQNTTSAHAVSS